MTKLRVKDFVTDCVCEKGCVRERLCVYDEVVCERLYVKDCVCEKLCVKDCGCDKVVCEKLCACKIVCVTKLCVKNCW